MGDLELGEFPKLPLEFASGVRVCAVKYDLIYRIYRVNLPPEGRHEVLLSLAMRA